MFALCVFGLYYFQSPWWCYVLLILGPDISMIGYAMGSHVGAGIYNLFHHKGLAIFIFGVGVFTEFVPLQITGIILFGHSSMDRMFGYGLKLNKGFNFTHLGVIGGKKR